MNYSYYSASSDFWDTHILLKIVIVDTYTILLTANLSSGNTPQITLKDPSEELISAIIKLNSTKLHGLITDLEQYYELQ